MEYLGLHNKPKAAVHLELLPTGPLKKKKKKKKKKVDNPHSLLEVTENISHKTSVI
jgi:hypothetical protein